MKEEIAMADENKNYFYYVKVPTARYQEWFGKYSDDFDYYGVTPVACICLTKNASTGKFTRGISICSPKDRFMKRLARAKAEKWSKNADAAKNNGQPWDVICPVLSDYLWFVLQYIEAEFGLNLFHTPPGELRNYKFFKHASYNLDLSDLTPFEQNVVSDTHLPKKDPEAAGNC